MSVGYYFDLSYGYWLQSSFPLGILIGLFCRAGSGESEAGAIFLPGIPSRHLLQTLQRELLVPCLCGFCKG